MILGVSAAKASEVDGTTTTTESSAESSGTDAKTERIEVTGSHIKRIDTEGASPIQTITRKEIEKTGYNSVGDVLRDSSANSFGSKREASGSNAAGTAHVSLRGLGSTNTLVLLNGQRLPTDAVTGAVDLNLIPIAAIERVEILKDGASAIYGSDALGGVVNIITRKDYSGTEVNVTQTLPEEKGGAKSEVSLVNGVNTEKLSLVNVLQFRNNNVIYSRDRKWTSNQFSNIGDPGSYRNNGSSWFADPNCPADRRVTTPQGTFCSYKYSDYMTELPDLMQISLMSEANYEVSSKVKLKARVGGTHRLVKWNYAAAPGQFTIPGAVADTVPGVAGLPGRQAGTDLDVRFRLTDLGTRDAEVTANAYNVLLGSTVQLTSDWALDVAGSHNMIFNEDKGVNGYALTNTLQSLIASGSYNPFASAGSRGSLESARYVPVEKTTSQLSSVDAKTSGQILELPNGGLGLALGTNVTYQKYKDIFDDRSVNGEVFGNAGSSGGGSRTSQALFAELAAPVLEKLEVSLAGRVDHYSDFGTTFNPKLGLLSKITPDLLVRASVGTGFKAPLMQDLYAATGQGYPTFIDQVACNAEITAGGATPSCNPQQYLVTSGGNPGLKEEKSLSYNLGSVYQATRNLSFGADVFMIRSKNVVGIDYTEMTRAEAAGINPSNFGVTVTRDGAGYITSVTAPLQNLSSQEVSGLDLSVGLRLTRWSFNTEHSHLFYFKQEGFPGTGKKDKLGGNGMPTWRNTVNVGFTPADRHDLNVTALTIGPHDKAVPERGRLPNYTSVDLLYSYDTNKFGTFSFGVKNVLGTEPPTDDTNPTKLDVTLYDQIGRQFLAGYKMKF